jgi:hypothetical protein
VKIAAFLAAINITIARLIASGSIVHAEITRCKSASRDAGARLDGSWQCSAFAARHPMAKLARAISTCDEIPRGFESYVSGGIVHSRTLRLVSSSKQHRGTLNVYHRFAKSKDDLSHCPSLPRRSLKFFRLAPYQMLRHGTKQAHSSSAPLQIAKSTPKLQA